MNYLYQSALKSAGDNPNEATQAAIDEPRWLDGLGLYNGIIIPHFDGVFYQFQLEFDTVQEYILPMSDWHDFIAIPNLSYILVDENGEKIYGDAYKISKRKVTKIN